VGYTVFRAGEIAFGPPSGGNLDRRIARLSDAMTNMRASIWRYPPGARGRRRAEAVQEELFVVLDGAATLMLGDPPERVELPVGSMAVVQPGTAVQVTNQGDGEATLLIVGAPPEVGQAAYLPDAG
jgi:mannose-6-phosphate isomerase-like protein (cupin superfamily)